MAAIKTKLSQRNVQTLPAPSVAWDTDLPGFMLITSPLGTRTYFVQRRDKTGRQVKVKIGRHDILGSARARTAAEQALAALTLGTLPERKAAKVEQKGDPDPQTLAELWQRHMTERQHGLAEHSIRSYASRWKHLAPLAGRKLGEIDRPQVETLHRELTRDVGPIGANTATRLLSTLLGFAELRGWIGRNPVRGVRRNREPGRECFLRGAKLTQVLDILRGSGLPVDVLILFLLATGARKGEALAMLWSDVDLEHATWTKRAATVKTRRTQHLPLSPEAVELLKSLPRAGVRVFHGVEGSRLQRRLAVIRKQIGMPELRVHDLRHSFASLVAANGGSLILIGKLLHHASVTTTARYAHLVDEQIREAAEQVGKVLAFRRPAA